MLPKLYYFSKEPQEGNNAQYHEVEEKVHPGLVQLPEQAFNVNLCIIFLILLFEKSSNIG